MTTVTLVYSLALCAYLSLLVRVLSRRPLTRLHWSCASVLVAFAFWCIEQSFIHIINCGNILCRSMHWLYVKSADHRSENAGQLDL